MIIKGSSRGQDRRDIRRLAEHLLSGENEAVEMVEISGVSAADLHGALTEMRMVAAGTRCRKCLYHASVNLDRAEVCTIMPEHWIEAVDELARRLGMEGHQRVIIRHRKHGREHVHVVWNRVDPSTLKVASDSHNYRTHEETSRILEARWNLRPVVGAHTKPADCPRPVASATHDDWQASERTGIAVGDVADRIASAWRASKNGREFTAALATLDLKLASGRRGLVVIDEAGTPHSIPRRLGIKAAEVHRKLADIDLATVMTVEQAKAAMKRRGRKKAMDGEKIFGIAAAAPTGVPTNWARIEKWWCEQGFAPERRTDGLWIRALDAWYRDLGDRIELHTGGAEPTDRQIAAMVSAGRARGWAKIRFYGGSQSFQQRARIEALRQGYRLDEISLECEDAIGGMAPPPVREEMPDYLRKMLGIPDPNAPAPPRRPVRPGPARRPPPPEAPAKTPVKAPLPVDALADRDIKDLGLDEAPTGHGPVGH